MDKPVRTETYRGYAIEIYPDYNPMDPRDWDNVSEMACYHPRYSLGDFNFKSGQQVLDHMDAIRDQIVCITWLSILDHSGLWLKAGTSFQCDPGGWDTSRIGYAYVTEERLKLMGTPRDRAEDVMKAEIEEYGAYIEGDVYGYVVKDPEGETVDSCWGFYSWHDSKGYMLNDYAYPAIDYDIKKRAQQHAEQVKAWIRNQVPLTYRQPFELSTGLCAQS